MSSHSNFDASSLDRKARLAKLASVKRKQPEPSTWGEGNEAPTTAAPPARAREEPTKDGPAPEKESKDDDMATKYLSGRNYDHETKTVKLGFEHAPHTGALTAEEQADQIAREANETAHKEEADHAPIDLFKLQPKKPNWDLKRDLDAKLEVLDVRTDNAIARLVRDRIEKAKEAALKKNPEGNGEGEEVGMEGAALVEGIHMRELERMDVDE